MVVAVAEQANPFHQQVAKWSLNIVCHQSVNAAVECAFEEGALGVSSFEIDEPNAIWRTQFMYAEAVDEGRVQAAIAAITEGFKGEAENIDYDIVAIEDRDWVAEVQASFPPLPIGQFMILGSHHSDVTPHPGVTPLYLDAGAAFGTGEHATTSGCLLALQRVMKRHADLYGGRCLDMGCGSGILAMGAAKKYHMDVTAVDIDAVSVKVAHANMERNQLSRRVKCYHGDGYKDKRVHGHYDLIFANILARPLMHLANDLRTHLKFGGVAILSGLLSRQERMVLAAHKLQGLHLVERITIDGWHVLVIRAD